MKFNFALILTLILFLSTSQQLFSQSKKRTFYELKVYHFETTEQELLLDNYLQKALLPALHRKKISSVGVFKPIVNDTASDKRIYVLIPLKSLKQFAALPGELNNDQHYNLEGSTYLDGSIKKAPYKRIESVFMQAFEGMPSLKVPIFTTSADKRIYELRSYESPTEKLHQNKVYMFNKGGEIALFNRLSFNAVFYATVLAGSRTPNLMYMTSFEDIAAREAHWKVFRNDPEWKKLSSNQFYKDNISKSEIILMHATGYSDI